MLKILHSPSQSVTGAAVVIAGATLMSRLVGLVRDRVFVHYFGAGPTMDAYYAAFKIPDLIYNLLIVGALTAGFIPTFTKLFYSQDDKTAAWRLVNNVINIVGAALLVLSSLGMIFTGPLTRVIAPGFAGETAKLVIIFTRIMLISPVLLGISMVVGGVLQSLKQFALYSVAPIFYNLGIIIGATLLARSAVLGKSALAWGVVLGALLHAGIQLYGAYHSGWRWRWQLAVRDPETKTIGKLMVPRTLGLAITQVNAVVVTVLASLLPAGSVTVYNLANNLQGVPTGLIGIPFALAVFPVLAGMAAEKNGDGFIQHLAATTRQILFLIIPVSLLVLLLRGQIVRVVLESGQFDRAAIIATANTLAFFALGLFAQALIPLYARAFYALANTKTPFTLGVIAELIAVIAALLLMKPLGVAGLALASAIGAIVNSALLVVALRLQAGALEDEKMASLLLRVALPTLAMGVIIQLLKYPLAKLFDLDHFWGIGLQGLIAGSAGLLAYGWLCYVLKVEEMRHLGGSLKRRWLRLWDVPAGIDEAEGL